MKAEVRKSSPSGNVIDGSDTVLIGTWSWATVVPTIGVRPCLGGKGRSAKNNSLIWREDNEGGREKQQAEESVIPAQKVE